MKNIDFNKIINLFEKALLNKYFMYTIIFIIMISTYKAIKEYKLYKFDCTILKQKPKPKGFMINTIIDIMGLSIITSIGFSGYFAYKNDFIKNKPIKKMKMKQNENETKYKITKVIKKEPIRIKLNKQTHKKKELINKKEKDYKRIEEENKKLLVELQKERAKRKLNKELLKAIQDVN